MTSGLRFGSAAGTTRGLGEAEFRRVGNWIADVLHAMAASGERDEAVEGIVCAEVRALCRAFPIYPGLDAAAADGQSSHAGRWRS